MNLLELPKVCDDVRERFRMTPSDLCRQAGIQLSTWYHWLEGKASPNVSTLSLIMDVLGLEVQVKRRNP